MIPSHIAFSVSGSGKSEMLKTRNIGRLMLGTSQFFDYLFMSKLRVVY